MLTRQHQVSDTVTDQALPARRTAPASSPDGPGRTDPLHGLDLRPARRGIDISARPAVTLSGSDGGFATVISNRLDEPVTVNVVAGPTAARDRADPSRQLAANSRSTVVLDAHANRVGVTNVTLSLTDVDGNPLGATDVLPIRSAQVSAVIWVIIGTGLALLFLAILVRLFRRIRGAPSEPPTPVETT